MSSVERKDLFLEVRPFLPRELNLLVMSYLQDYCPWWSRRLGVKKVYDVEVLSVEECKELHRESSRCSRTLLLDGYRVSSTFYYNIEEDEASGQYYDEDDLVTWYYGYETQNWFFV